MTATECKYWKKLCACMCICMHLCQTHSYLCVFPLWRSWQATEPPSSGCSNASEHKEPHSESSAVVSHTHTVSQEDTRAHPAHSLESLWKAMCTYTAVKHSQENIKQYRTVREEEMKEKTQRSPHLSMNCLPPAISSAVIYAHQTYTGIIPAAYNNILVYLRISGVHIPCVK